MTTWQRYWLYQLPGLGVAGALLAFAAHRFSLPLWACGVGLGLWAVKDAVLYPFLKASYEGAAESGPEAMVGSLGTVVDGLTPHGLVRIGPELWRAESDEPLDAGQTVRVTGCTGMTMRVEPVSG